MPTTTNVTYISAIVPTSGYRVDDRVTISTGAIRPEYHNVNNGPTVICASGVRCFSDMWPNSSGF
jgi:hypothetical protein